LGEIATSWIARLHFCGQGVVATDQQFTLSDIEEMTRLWIKGEPDMPVNDQLSGSASPGALTRHPYALWVNRARF